MIDTVVVCPEHGDLWLQWDAGPGAPIIATYSDPCQEWVPRPLAGGLIECPRCGRQLLMRRQLAGLVAGGLKVEHRPRVRILGRAA